MLEVEHFSDGSMACVVVCDYYGRSYCTSYTTIPPLAAANMADVDGLILCAECAKGIYNITAKR